MARPCTHDRAAPDGTDTDSRGDGTWSLSLARVRLRMDPMSSREGDRQAVVLADTVARRSYGKLVAFLAARTRDVASAEDALSEAFLSALADWPVNGCPSNPEGWLLTVARRKMIDAGRRRRSHDEAAGDVRMLAEELQA